MRVSGAGRTNPGAEPLGGSPAELVESLRAFGREGISHIEAFLAPNAPEGIEAFAPVLELCDRD